MNVHSNFVWPSDNLGSESSNRKELFRSLSQVPRRIPPKFLFDPATGFRTSELDRAKDFYLMRSELEILMEHGHEIAHLQPKNIALIDLAPENSNNARALLRQADKPVKYFAVSKSLAYLQKIAQEFSEEFPDLKIRMIETDISDSPRLQVDLPSEKSVIYFSNSHIAQFFPFEAQAFLEMMGRRNPDSDFLISVDLRKDPEILEGALNDENGIAAQANMQLLSSLNQRWHTNFDVTAFGHFAYYNRFESRIEMGMMTEKSQDLRIGEDEIYLSRNEKIITQIAHKYTIEEFQTLARSSGWSPVAYWKDRQGLYSVHYLSHFRSWGSLVCHRS
jgi:uncharacterized SAM-dependent methyltransferase